MPHMLYVYFVLTIWLNTLGRTTELGIKGSGFKSRYCRWKIVISESGLKSKSTLVQFSNETYKNELFETVLKLILM